ncbi:MFS transporter [Sinomonas sp. P47F7]|uniref:MFS transporter n=1 Tax=Sinomonas sp. P47F7 TaxID=3410987 RepID=UPI003BF61139
MSLRKAELTKEHRPSRKITSADGHIENSARARCALIGGAFALYLITGAGTSILGSTSSDIIEFLAPSTILIGFIRAGRQAGQLAASLTFARIQGHRSLASTATIGAGGFAVGVLIVAFSRSDALTIIGAVLWGAGHGALDLSATVIMSHSFGQRASVAMSLLHVTYGIGGGIGPFFVVLIRSAMPWTVGYVILAGAAIVAVAPIVICRNKNLLAATDNGSGYARRIPTPRLAPSAVVIFCFNGVNAGLVDWTYHQSIAVAHSTVMQAAAAVASYWVGITIGRLVVVSVLRRVEDTDVIVTCAVLSGVVGILAILASTPMMFVVAMGLLGLFLAPIYPVSMARQANLAGDRRRTAIAQMMAAAALGAIFVPILQGIFGGSLVVTAAFTVFLAASALMQWRNDQRK